MDECRTWTLRLTDWLQSRAPPAKLGASAALI